MHFMVFKASLKLSLSFSNLSLAICVIVLMYWSIIIETISTCMWFHLRCSSFEQTTILKVYYILANQSHTWVRSFEWTISNLSNPKQQKHSYTGYKSSETT